MNIFKRFMNYILNRFHLVLMNQETLDELTDLSVQLNNAQETASVLRTMLQKERQHKKKQQQHRAYLENMLEERNEKIVQKNALVKTLQNKLTKRKAQLKCQEEYISLLKAKNRFYAGYTSHINEIYDRMAFVMVLPEAMRMDLAPQFRRTYLETLELENSPLYQSKQGDLNHENKA